MNLYQQRLAQSNLVKRLNKQISEQADQIKQLQQSFNQLLKVNTVEGGKTQPTKNFLIDKVCKRVEALEKAYHVVDSACVGWGLTFDLSNPQESLKQLIRIEIAAATDPFINSKVTPLNDLNGYNCHSCGKQQ